MISESESHAIKYIRVGAMIAIVICHFFQAYGSLWAFVFNIGVQVFLALSGYLYGKKIIANWESWAISRVKRVYIPMLLFVIAVLPLYLLFHREIFSWKAYALNIVNLQGVPFVMGWYMLLGIRHLWFLTAIMLAYFTTPLLQNVRNHAEWFFLMLVGCFGVSFFIVPGPLVFFISWFALYAICYLYVQLRRTRLYDYGLVLLELALIILVILHTNVLTIYCHPINRLFHDVSGVFIVLFGIRILSKMNLKCVPAIVNSLDRYSFQIFIVHYFLIIGPFSLAHLTESLFLNVIISVIAIFVSTILFSFICTKVNYLLFEKKYENQLDRNV